VADDRAIGRRAAELVTGRALDLIPIGPVRGAADLEDTGGGAASAGDTGETEWRL
jgi:hypothetical protein